MGFPHRLQTVPRQGREGLASQSPVRELSPQQSPPISTGKEVCYGDIGCFSDAEPWAGTAIRPLKILPWSPEKIGTRFQLYTNKNPNTFQVRPLFMLMSW